MKYLDPKEVFETAFQHGIVAIGAGVERSFRFSKQLCFESGPVGEH
jgi:hypothetical protein